MSKIVDVILPKEVGEDVESLVVMWYKEVGDMVEEEEILVEVQTDKAIYELPSPADGIITEIIVKRGEVAAVGQVMAKLDTSMLATSSESNKAIKIIENEIVTPQVTKTIKASPLIKKIAKEHNIDLNTIVGTGSGGKILEADINAILDNNNSKGNSGFEIVKNSPVRKATAKHMFSSMKGSAQLTLHRWVDVTELNKKRKKLAPDTSWNDWVLRAVVIALQNHKDMNAHWISTETRKLLTVVNLGIAVDTNQGLVVPVIKNAEQFSLEELSIISKELQQKAANFKLKSDEINEGTFTVTNLGGLGIEFFTPILNAPQVGILGIGKLDKRVVYNKGENGDRIGQNTKLPLSITFDHQAIDGVPAARFLQTLEELFQNPEKLI